MKRKSQIRSMEVGYEEFRALSAGRQRYVILKASFVEPGDFIELIEKLDDDMKEREAERYVVQITHESGLVPALDPEYTIVSVARVTNVALRLLDATRVTGK